MASRPNPTLYGVFSSSDGGRSVTRKPRYPISAARIPSATEMPIWETGETGDSNQLHSFRIRPDRQSRRLAKNLRPCFHEPAPPLPHPPATNRATLKSKSAARSPRGSRFGATSGA
jgi:hypothetical protein